MMKKMIFAALVFSTSPVLAKQSLQAATVQNPKLAQLITTIKDAAGVDCVLTDSFPGVSIQGPEGKKAVTHQVACFDPDAFNPTQLGQLFVTYYGDGEKDNSSVGAVINIKFEVFK